VSYDGDLDDAGVAAPAHIDMSGWAMFSFDENEARDKAGKWTKAGGEGAGDALSQQLFGKGERAFKAPGDKRLATATEELFGKAVTKDQIADLAGATNGAIVKITLGQSGVGGVWRTIVKVDVKHALYTQKREIVKGKDGKLVVKNKSFYSTEEAPPGMGTRMMAKQVETARELGVAQLETWADGNKHSHNNGYYTWPRLGYDMPLPDYFTLMAEKNGFKSPKTVTDLMCQPGGAEWWKEWGRGGAATFDLDPDSVSSQVHAAYLEEKGVRLGTA
jgi:hypothetical protein